MAISERGFWTRRSNASPTSICCYGVAIPDASARLAGHPRIFLQLKNLLWLFLAVGVHCLSAIELRVATLNAYLMFDPAVEHRARVGEALTGEEYKTKVDNLAGLIDGCDFVGLEEMGGRDEVMALAARSGYSGAFVHGRDTATGEEVGALYRMPGWKVAVNGRVPSLDAKLSKHLLVTATQGPCEVEFLVVHLIRPIGKNADKHAQQLDAIGVWMVEEHKNRPNRVVIVLGDTNDVTVAERGSLFGPGEEAGRLNNFASTHLMGKPFDRLVLFGNAEWRNVAVVRPPYAKRPNDFQKKTWTDHYLLSANVLITRAPQ